MDRFTDLHESPEEWNNSVGLDKKLMQDYFVEMDRELADLHYEIKKIVQWQKEAQELILKLPD